MKRPSTRADFRPVHVPLLAEGLGWTGAVGLRGCVMTSLNFRRQVPIPIMAAVQVMALSGQSSCARVCPLLDQSGQSWILARDGLSASDQQRTLAVQIGNGFDLAGCRSSGQRRVFCVNKTECQYAISVR